MNWSNDLAKPARKKGINSKQKGNRAEREIVAIFVDLFVNLNRPDLAENVRRTGLQLFKPGKDIVGVPKLAIEVKHVQKKNLNLPKFWEQCQKNAGGLFPVLIYKVDFQGWKVRCWSCLYLGSGCHRYVVSDIELPAFLEWYRELATKL